jgi:hypothetical protein
LMRRILSKSSFIVMVVFFMVFLVKAYLIHL